jgi:hypothetical protein
MKDVTPLTQVPYLAPRFCGTVIRDAVYINVFSHVTIQYFIKSPTFVSDTFCCCFFFSPSPTQKDWKVYLPRERWLCFLFDTIYFHFSFIKYVKSHLRSHCMNEMDVDLNHLLINFFWCKLGTRLRKSLPYPMHIHLLPLLCPSSSIMPCWHAAKQNCSYF